MLRELVLPPGSILLVAVALFLLLRRRPAAVRALFLATLALFYALSTPLVSGRLLHSLEWYPAILPGRASPAVPGGGPPAEAIVVLSAGRLRAAPMYGGDTVDALTLERLRFAARLHHATGLPVLATGGPPPDAKWPRPMSALMAEVLERDFHVRPVWTESRSTNTAENAEFTAAELAARSVGRVYLVTHGWHLPRAARSFARTPLAIIPAPATQEGVQGLEAGDLVPTARAFAESAYGIHEWIGLAWYRLRYPAR